VKTAHRLAVFDSIAQNNLGEWLSGNNTAAFNSLKDKFVNSGNQWDQMRGHFLSYMSNRPDQSDVRAADSFLTGLLTEYDYYKGTVCEYRKPISARTTGFTCNN